MLAFAGPACAGDLPVVTSSKLSMIVKSARDYGHNCPCPYSIADDGDECKGTSAWCRPDGEKPLCYTVEIPNSEAEEFTPLSGKLMSKRRDLGDLELALLSPYACPQQTSALFEHR